MGGVDLDRCSQRVACALEAGFEDVVSVLARELYKVDRGGHIPGKAQPELRGALHIKIADLNRVKFSLNPYNINRLTLKAGQAALEDTAYFDTTRAAIVETRSWTRKQLEARGFTVLDSRSNFLFVRTARQDGGTLYRKLKENGVLVRHFDAPRIHSWLRITIGTPAQMQALLAALDKILED